MICYSIQQHWYQDCSGKCSDPCNSYDGHSLYQHWCLIICIHQSWFIWYQQLTSVLLNHHACYSLFLQTATVCSQHTCINLLHHTDTALTTQQTVPVWHRQFWAACRRQQPDTAMISYLYHTIILLHQTDTAPWQPNRLFRPDTVSSEQSVGVNSLIQLWYHTCVRPEGATGCNRSVAFLRV